MTTYKKILEELEWLGSETCRATYVRHGISGEAYGVKFWDLDKVTKRLRREYKDDQKGLHELATGLWNTHNCDAGHLAMKICVAELLDQKHAEKWISEFGFCLCESIFADVVAKTTWWPSAISDWMPDDRDWFRAMGYDTLTAALKDHSDNGVLPDDFVLSSKELSVVLSTIESQIHNSPNNAKYSMNNTLIWIGGYVAELTSEAIETAKRIGKVDVDHGNTSCKTPDAASYIEKMVTRRK